MLTACFWSGTSDNGQLGVNDLKAYTRTAEKLGSLVCKVDYILPSHNCTMIPSVWLLKMRDAFRGINDGSAHDYTDYPDDGVRFYDFGYFSAWYRWTRIRQRCR